MARSKRSIDTDMLAAIEAGIAEANRRERGGFDGLLGQLDGDAPEALREIVSDLRAFLLARHHEDELRALLEEYELPVPDGQHAGVITRNLTPLPADEELAISLFNTIRSTMRCTGERLDRLILGPRIARHRVRSKIGGARSAVTRRAGSKAQAIIAAAKAYRGAPRDRAAKLARKCNSTPQYVRAVLSKEKRN